MQIDTAGISISQREKCHLVHRGLRFFVDSTFSRPIRIRSDEFTPQCGVAKHRYTAEQSLTSY